MGSKMTMAQVQQQVNKDNKDLLFEKQLEGIIEIVALQDDNKYKELVEVIGLEFQALYGTHIMKTLTEMCTLQSLALGHLKRIKRSEKPNHLLAIVCKDSIDNSLLKELTTIDSQAVLVLSMKVPRWPARTRTEYNLNSKIWPMTFHENSSKEVMQLEMQEKYSILKFMECAIQDSKVLNPPFDIKSGCLYYGAIIVDPSTGNIVATSSEKQEDGNRLSIDDTLHPLMHAALRVIEKIAQADSFKKQCLETHKDSAAEVAVDSKVVASGVAVDSAVGVAVASSTGSTASSYLCTGYDVYLVHEPCVMCAMALVHSRVRRVIYSKLNTIAGALKSHYMLHTSPFINHRYRVFQCTPIS